MLGEGKGNFIITIKKIDKQLSFLTIFAMVFLVKKFCFVRLYEHKIK